MKILNLTLISSCLSLAILMLTIVAPVITASGQAWAAPTYSPPKDVGKPNRRAGAGTRSANQKLVNLDVLAPEHTGLGTEPQPTLYWSISEPTAKGVNFLLIALHDPINPLLETRLSATQSGIQSINLTEHDIALEPGIIYEWSVSLSGSASNYASGTIKYIAPPAKLQESLEDATERDVPNIYASNGIWYNAIDDSKPTDTSLREDRITLLQQVDLKRVATFDKLP